MVAGDRFSDENGVRINRLGITDSQQLAQAETDSSLLRLQRLNMQGGIPGGRYDHAHLKQVHEKLFEGVYQWAGETRADREFQGHKPTYVTGFKETMTYAPYKEIEPRLNAIGEQLGKENYLKGLPEEKFAERAAYYLDQYNHAHAFRDGNGRTLQATFVQLGKEAGYQVDFARIDPATLNRARDLAMVRPHAPQEAEKNLQALKAMFEQVISPAPGLEAEKLRDPSQARPLAALSAQMQAMDARREFEVTGYRVMDIVANMPGAGNYEKGVAVGKGVEATNLNPAAIQTHLGQFQQAAEKISKHPALQGPDAAQDQRDARRFRAAAEQVQVIAVTREAASAQRPLPQTHAEAQTVFKDAARQVAQGLREHGKGLEATRLQEVSRHVERTPFIGGLNRENIGKSIDAADKIAALNGSRQLDELKSAVGIMEKPPKELELGTAKMEAYGRDVRGIER
ncbi:MULTISPECIES: Fic/DOC family protein [unclassified Hymenobacter]|uniref:Fic/DOC family protein n=1 Tax=unclassified Hymenobacter TaxID=2615202 RepID=UPI0016538490|nr:MULTISPECIES: Fic family protein [unclassified Hymenobacter]MBC6992166.1 Fic family protein [Hymenobacter sp. BT491]MCC3154735.1 Fic family protein [Hymenobacter sp. BT770]MDO3416550.1 Fic family protein [Hymenobacter sp. BT770]